MSGFIDNLLDRMSDREVAIRPRRPEPFSQEPSSELLVEDQALDVLPVARSGLNNFVAEPEAWSPTIQGTTQEPEPAQAEPTDRVSPSVPQQVDDAKPELPFETSQRIGEPTQLRVVLDSPAPIRVLPKTPDLTQKSDETTPSNSSASGETGETKISTAEVRVNREIHVSGTNKINVVQTNIANRVAPSLSSQSEMNVTSEAAPLAHTPLRTSAPTTAPTPAAPLQVNQVAAKTGKQTTQVEPPIQIDIGRVEIHAPAAAGQVKPVRPKQTKTPKVMTLDTYLDGKGGR